MAALSAAQNLQPRPHSAQTHAGKRRVSIYWTWSYPWESQSRPRGDGQPVFHDDGSSPRRVARL